MSEGRCDEGFAGLREVFDAGLADGRDLGASLAVTVDGEPVVDLWGGWADEERTRPWQADTLVNVWSTTKTVAALVVLVLVDRGEVDLDAPVARYWPEFAANGKDGVLVRHVLSHSSGVSGWDQPVTQEDLCDWERSTAALAAQAPWFEPGSVSGYHLVSQGHLLGEVVRRVTGSSIGTVLREEVTGPLGADFHIGLPAADHDRVAPVVPPPPVELPPMDPASPAVRALTGPVVDARFTATGTWRTAEVPAAGGHGNARSVARIQSVVACGGEVDGVRLLSPRTVDLALQEQTRGVDVVLGIPLRFGLGYALPWPEVLPHLPAGRVGFWGGWGGSVVVVDRDRRMTVAYMMNRMQPGIIGSPRSDALVRAAYASLPG
ncbi:serine hydrolase domain-containing protein [Thalassiella azotivora]